MSKESIQQAAEDYKKRGVGSKYDFIAGATSQAAKEYWRKEFEKELLPFLDSLREDKFSNREATPRCYQIDVFLKRLRDRQP